MRWARSATNLQSWAISLVREGWLDEMARAIGSVTASLFPEHAILVRPVPHIESTTSRIMAGYLLLCDASDSVTLIYCELRSFAYGEAGFAIYRDEFCEQELAALQLTKSALIGTYTGVHCDIFGVGSLKFCARSSKEKNLWLRAVLNVKTKLVYDAPDPTVDEIAVFRNSVQECVGQLTTTTPREKSGMESAALPLKPRAPMPASPVGDVMPLVPMDSAADLGALTVCSKPSLTREGGGSSSSSGNTGGVSPRDLQVLQLCNVGLVLPALVAEENAGDLNAVYVTDVRPPSARGRSQQGSERAGTSAGGRRSSFFGSTASCLSGGAQYASR
eukprot:NODE_13865_length_1142_cov_3.513300.p1 GENE.NODE_13865_length_1142_cov_3.513300~~NODE_13865_length_1142_cov_3.513300.p1  ORF type:complete len:332 (+),score=69.42 NODE_13865_length_1142_cov_3.513300:111-1106(+)